MIIYVTSEYRFTRLPDASIWTETAFPYSYWERYLDAFSEVRVLARVREKTTPLTGGKRVDGKNVSVFALPDYQGPLGYFQQRGEITKLLDGELRPENALILSVPSPISLLLEKIIRRKNLVYGAEAMGDPWEVFSRSGIRHPLRIYFRLSLTARMKKQISGAASVAYVTEKTLQKRYPSGFGALSTGVSNIDLLPTHLARTAKTRNASEVLRITSVGSLEQLYKNPDIVLQAVARCVQDGMKIQLTWIGGGAFLPEMIRLAKSLGIERSVRFLGQLPSGDAIREELDQSDLFVLASKTEGLPRALIEAMARGLPCIGSDVGGIPELLEPRELFLPNLPEALFAKIKEVAANPELMKEMGKRNLRKSREFLKEKLDRKRAVFLRELRLRTESALK